MPSSPSTSEASAREKREPEESMGSVPGACAGGEPPLDQDDLVQQVMNELKQPSGGAPVPPSGGAQADREEELIDIEIDSGATIRPASQRAKQAGEQLGQQLRRQEEERRRTLRVGGLTVKLPPAKTGEPARGTLTAKIKRVSQTLGGPQPQESLAARMKSG